MQPPAHGTVITTDNVLAPLIPIIFLPLCSSTKVQMVVHAFLVKMLVSIPVMSHQQTTAGFTRIVHINVTVLGT